MAVLFQVIVALCLCVTTPAYYNISLEEVSTTYPPQNNSRFDMQYMQKASYDVRTNLLYVTGKMFKYFIDLTNTQSLAFVGAEMSDTGNIHYTDVATCGKYVIVTVDYIVNRSMGVVEIYNQYSPEKRSEKIYSIEVYSDPVSVVFTRNCMTGVVSVRGTPHGYGQDFVDPLGQIVIISFPDMHATGNFSDLVKITTLNFTKFDTKATELIEKGVRFVYREGNNSLSNDLEPGSITTTPNSEVAYVVLQKNNALAVVDLVTKSITKIFSLGMKDWSQLKMDTSDKDGGIHLKKWPIYSYYLPDGVQYFIHGNRGYLVTANEGTSANFTQEVGWSEVLRGCEFIEKNLTDDTVSDEMKTWLAKKADLGSLYFTTRNGEKTNDSFTKFVTFGGRSFSVWRAVDLQLMYDSADEMETKTAELRPDLFNTGTSANSTLISQVDKQSNNKGPEPKSVAVGRIGALTVIFVGSSAPGSIFVYSIHKNISEPKFECMWTSVGNTSDTWNNLFANKTLRATDPQQIIFLPKYSSPTGEYALIVLGAKSGTVTLLNIKTTGTIPQNDAARGQSVAWLQLIFVIYWVYATQT